MAVVSLTRHSCGHKYLNTEEASEHRRSWQSEAKNKKQKTKTRTRISELDLVENCPGRDSARCTDCLRISASVSCAYETIERQCVHVLMNQKHKKKDVEPDNKEGTRWSVT